jgi:hypothetical protein
MRIIMSIRVRNFNAWHPELAPGERFIGNMPLSEFEQCEWKTKRRGIMAYDMYGVRTLTSGAPVFVQLSELEEAGVTLEDITFVVIDEWTGPTDQKAFQAAEELRFALTVGIRPEEMPAETWETLLAEIGQVTHNLGMPQLGTYFATDNYNSGGALLLHTPCGEIFIHGTTVEMLSL